MSWTRSRGSTNRLLIGATELALADLVRHIHDLGGIAIASHIDRESFSVISQLGFVDPEIPFDALEISGRTGLARARRKYPELANYPFLASSDAHRIEEIGSGYTEIFLEEPSVQELKMAFAGQGGRRIAGFLMLELALHILDIAENSVRAGAKTVFIDITEDRMKDRLLIEIRDDGAGMDEATLKKAMDPFYTSKKVRRVGLGLPMLAEAAERAGGSFAH